MTGQARYGVQGPADKVGYLVSEYPAASHTFIRREIAALRRHGLDIKPYSVRPCSDTLDAPLDRAARAETHAILGQSAVTMAAAHVHALIRHPLRYVSTALLAMRHRVPGMRALLWAGFHFVEAIVLARQLKRDGIACLHNHFANSGATVGMLAAHFARLPWSLTLHGISETDYPAGLLLSQKISVARFVACVSWFGRAQAMRVCDQRDWHKFEIVRCGIEMDALPTTAAPNAKTSQPKRIICVGRLSAEKGQQGLLEAFARIHENDDQVSLMLVGSGPMEQELRRSCNRLCLGQAVHFAGRLDEIATLQAIAAADVLVLPSLMEGLPIVLMEAMALGVPVVASRVAGVPELVDDGISGLLFRPADWIDMEMKLRQLLNDSALAENLAEAGMAAVRDQFDIDLAVQPMCTLLRPRP